MPEMSHGGKRKGAGRKPSPDSKQAYGTKLTPKVIEFLRQHENAAQFLDDKVRRSKEFRDWKRSKSD